MLRQLNLALAADESPLMSTIPALELDLPPISNLPTYDVDVDAFFEAYPDCGTDENEDMGNLDEILVEDEDPPPPKRVATAPAVVPTVALPPPPIAPPKPVGPPPPVAPPARQSANTASWDEWDLQQNPFQTAREMAGMPTNPPPPQQSTNPYHQQQHPSANPYQQPPPNPYQQQHPHANPYQQPTEAAPPPAPPIRDSLRRKFQPPKRAAVSSNNQGGTAPKPSTTKDSNNEEEDLPEELQRYGKELVEKIQMEIMDTGEPVTFDDIAGLSDAKQTIQEVICWPMKRPDLFTGLRKAPNGLLLYGPPGTGKTLIGKAIAHESGATFFSISSSSLTSKWIGEGEKLVRTLFGVAAYHEPSVVFLDEIDSLLTQRKADENEASRRIKTEFLVQLDGTCATQGRVLAIGATNRPQELDEAARRRFVKRLYIPLPNQDDREQLLRVMLHKCTGHSLTDAEIAKLARETEGFSGADLKALSTDAAMGPIRQLGPKALEANVADLPPISYKHFRQARKSMKASVAAADLVQYEEWDAIYGSKREAYEDASSSDEEE